MANRVCNLITSTLYAAVYKIDCKKKSALTIEKMSDWIYYKCQMYKVPDTPKGRINMTEQEYMNIAIKLNIDVSIVKEVITAYEDKSDKQQTDNGYQIQS